MVFSTDPVTGIAVLEYGLTEILPPVGALSKHTERLCRPGRQASRAHPRGKPGFWTFESGCGRETDSPLEQAGFELVWGFSCQVVVLGLWPVLCSELEGPFFVPSPAIRFPERAEGVKGPKR